MSEYHISERKRGKNYYPKACKRCVNARVRMNYDPKKKKSQHLKYNYGISMEDYAAKLESQSGLCAICKSDSPNGKGNYFHVDHNHKTKKVRGLLCHNCNLFIGYAKEDKNILEAGIEYLRIWGDES